MVHFGRATPYIASLIAITVLFFSYNWIADTIIRAGLKITFNMTLYYYLVFVVLYFIYDFIMKRISEKWI